MEPQRKKTKLESAALTPPIAVLDDQYYDNIDTIEVYVGKVIEKSFIGDLVQQLKTVFPMANSLVHLKRVRGDEIILTPVQNYDKSVCLDIIEERLQGLQSTIEVCKVPGKLPKTKKQHQQANALWPCNFHPSKETEKLLSQTFFTPHEVTKQHEYMRLALKAAEENGVSVGAVVVNPKSDQVVAVSHDERAQNPAHHAVMTVLENVAATQRTLYSNVEAVERKKKEDLPYLCTGFDLYVTREPCIMCAMAMVHSRVRRVFYGYQSEHGALGTKCKVHTRTALNHHYLVFRNVLSDECKMLEKYSFS